MSEALVYLSAILFAAAVFPVHVIGYAYFSSSERYASVNLTLYRVITVLRFNTDKKVKTDGKEGDKDKFLSGTTLLDIFNNLCITKIVQLGDYGMKNPDNAYVALCNSTLTHAVYTFVKLNGGKTKLKNYSVLNYETDYVNYYLKLAGVINVITLVKLYTVYIWGKLYEHKT